jgi:alanyl-tRNA synthetase
VTAHEPLARAAAALPGCALLLLSHDTGGVLLAASADSGVDAGALLKGALAAHGGRGGGTPRLAQGALPAGAPLLPLLGALGFGGG